MQILLILVAIAAVAFWWYRVRRPGTVNGRGSGSADRGRIANRAALAPSGATADPVLAAATIITAIMTEGGPLDPAREEVMRNELGTIATPDRIDAVMAQASEAAAEMGDAAKVIDALAPVLAARLDEAEKQAMLTMTRRVALADTEPLPMLEPRLRRLRQKLGTVIA